jgi:hypothetical protein
MPPGASSLKDWEPCRNPFATANPIKRSIDFDIAGG